VRVEPKTTGIAAITHKHYAASSTLFGWQSGHFNWIAPGQAYP